MIIGIIEAKVASVNYQEIQNRIAKKPIIKITERTNMDTLVLRPS